MKRKVILWVEDRPKTIEKLETYCQKLMFDIKIVATAHEFKEFLDKRKTAISLIIVDLMLYGVPNLESIKIGDSDTDAGYDAGWIIIERLLRPDLISKPYSHIPIAIVSSRNATDTDNHRLSLLNQGGEIIPYFEKYGLNPEGTPWEKQFQEFISTINEKIIGTLE